MSILAYLSSEKDNAIDELLYNSKKDPILDAELKAKAKTYDAIMGLDDYLYSMELKKPDASTTEADTRVDDDE